MGEGRFTVRPTAAELLTEIKPIITSSCVICGCGTDVKCFSLKTGALIHRLPYSSLITDMIVNPANRYQIICSYADGTVAKWNYEDAVLVSMSESMRVGDKWRVVVYKMTSITGDDTDKTTASMWCLLKLLPLDSTKRSVYKLASVSVHDMFDTNHDIKNSIHDDSYHTEPLFMVGGRQGNFVAIVPSKADLFITFGLRSQKRREHKVKRDASMPAVQQCLAPITCITGHPNEDCVAVGHKDGKINIWSNILDRKSTIHSWVHWHALPVLSLAYAADGGYLLSGGHESVLVKWVHGSYGDSEMREYLPRLGAPVTQISVCSDSSIYSTCHRDNSVKLIQNWIVSNVIQGLSIMYTTGSDSTAYPIGVKFDPRSGAMVTNGLPGHIQFYSLSADKLLYNLDVVGQNYVSGDRLPLTSDSNTYCYTTVEVVSFSSRGSWMATVERWADPRYTQQCRLKLWYYDSHEQTYVLNTDIDRPHKSAVICCSFTSELSHSEGQTTEDGGMWDELHLVTVGEGCKEFKIWTLADGGDGNSFSWRHKYSGHYRDKLCSEADFSSDGSILVAAFGDCLTLWDPENNQLCTSVCMDSAIKSIRFLNSDSLRFSDGGVTNFCSTVCVLTEKAVILWDIIDYTEKFCWKLDGFTGLTVDHCLPVAIAYNAKSVVAMDCSHREKLELDLPPHIRQITSCSFRQSAESEVTESDGGSGDEKPTVMDKALQRLYFCSKSIYRFELSSGKSQTDSDRSAASGNQIGSIKLIADNFRQSSRLYQLITSSATISNTNDGDKDNKRQRESEQLRYSRLSHELIKQLAETSCVAMPSVDSLCSTYLRSLLIGETQTATSKQTKVNGKQLNNEDEEFSEDDEDSPSDVDSDVPRQMETSAYTEDNLQPVKLSKRHLLSFKSVV